MLEHLFDVKLVYRSEMEPRAATVPSPGAPRASSTRMRIGRATGHVW